MEISIHALREEGDRATSTPSSRISNFYPRPPRGGRLEPVEANYPVEQISIHALREEGDVPLCAGRETPKKFLSTPSARRATAFPPQKLTCDANFYPRPPRGGRPESARLCAQKKRISIHALREEGDYNMHKKTQHDFDFYPRPPRGGRLGSRSVCGECVQFLSTPSARRATRQRKDLC